MDQIKRDHQNPLVDVVELLLNSGNDTEFSDNTPVYAELRFAVGTIDLEEFSFTAGIRSAQLSLVLDGCEIVPGTRLHDDTEVKATRTFERVDQGGKRKSIGGKASGSISPDKLSMTASGESEASTNRETGETEKLFVSEVAFGVICKPGNRWEILNIENMKNGAILDQDRCLDSTFLPNQKLCSVSVTAGANRTEAAGVVSVRKQDIVVQPEGHQVERAYRNLLHRDKMISAVLANCLAKGTGQYAESVKRGSVIVAQSRLATGGDFDD